MSLKPSESSKIAGGFTFQKRLRLVNQMPGFESNQFDWGCGLFGNPQVLNVARNRRLSGTTSSSPFCVEREALGSLGLLSKVHFKGLPWWYSG